MKTFLTLTSFIFLLLNVNVSKAELSLDIKINKIIGDKTVQVVQKMKANFDQDIILSHSALQDKIILTFKKFNNISVNGAKINPIQVDLKTVDSNKKQVGKIKTITSFYQREAFFQGENDGEKWTVDLGFEEI